jgi:hypothetical protein
MDEEKRGKWIEEEKFKTSLRVAVQDGRFGANGICKEGFS